MQVKDHGNIEDNLGDMFTYGVQISDKRLAELRKQQLGRAENAIVRLLHSLSWALAVATAATLCSAFAVLLLLGVI